MTNYNEDEEDPFEEEEAEDDATPNYWDATVEDTGPAIDKVLDYEPKPGVGM